MNEITGERTYYVVLVLMDESQGRRDYVSVVYSTQLRINTRAGIDECRTLALTEAAKEHPERCLTKAFIISTMELV